jgi:hypothetical protein
LPGKIGTANPTFAICVSLSHERGNLSCGGAPAWIRRRGRDRITREQGGWLRGS